jgi:hypothetical protein
MSFPYIYFWNRCARKGHSCRVLARGKLNSCCVEFEDGWRMITSRNALRRAVCAQEQGEPAGGRPSEAPEQREDQRREH